MQIWEQYVDYNKIKFTTEKRERGQRSQIVYCHEICAFDIETTRIVETDNSFMYVWQFSIDNKVVIMGRTWDQFLHMCGELVKAAQGRHIMVFVHNLSHEFQFLTGIYSFDNDEVFAMESRTILHCRMFGCLDFRCAWKLSNLSLEAFTSRYNCNYKKRSGADFDYTIFRTPTTKLKHKEMLYCAYDVLGLVEAVRALMALHNDNLYTLPYTSTGYVRREAKKAMRPERGLIQASFPNFEVFTVLRQAFRGGNTHANRYYSGEIVENVHSVDIASSYPSQQCNKKYPIGPLKKVGYLSTSREYLEKLIDRGYAVLAVICIDKLDMVNPWVTMPYLAYSKTIGPCPGAELDNGRVMRAKHIKIAVTDLDYKIIMQQYTGKLTVEAIYYAGYDYLPDGLRELNKQYFTDKTKLKGVDGQELFYAKSKELLNSIYGMSVQNPVRQTILFDMLKYNVCKTVPDYQLLAEAKRGAFEVYQWGVWTTAHARTALQAGIDICGDDIIYCDTDSCKYVGDHDFTAYNADRVAECLESGAWANDKDGTPHYMGVYESEDNKSGFAYQRFITLGAKKYAFEYLDKKGNLKLGITVSGVSKRYGAAELAARGGLEAFKPGFVFENSGKLEAVYNDSPAGDWTTETGEVIPITNNVCLRPTTYKIGITDDYSDLLTLSAKQLNKVKEICTLCR